MTKPHKPYASSPSTKAWQTWDKKHHLHPFTDLHDYSQHGGRVISRAEHIYVIDSDGHKTLDGMSGLWCCNLGYSREDIIEAINQQLHTLPFYNNFFQCANEPSIALAKALTEVTPKPFNHVFFTNSGSEANDTIIRLLHRYFDLLGKPEKKQIISRRNAYHGSTIAGASLGGMDFVHQQFIPLPYVHHIQQPYWFKEGGNLGPEEFGIAAARELASKIDELGEDQVAAFIAEPIQGAGGVIVPPASYWPEIHRICQERDVLFVSDEVICGFGRTGDWFGCESYGTEPDLLVFAKGITNGYQPLGGVMVGDKVANVLTDRGGEFGHGFTYSGHPVACAAALATLDILKQENVVERVKEDIGPYLQQCWQKLADHPIVGEVRGKGMLGALELVSNKKTKERLAPNNRAGVFCRGASIRNGLIMRATGDTMIIAPPLICSHKEIDALVERAGLALDETAREFGVIA